MAGTAQAADRIRCDRCTGHYVVDAASDGSPRVRCNECGHLREGSEQPAPASIPGKWTVIGPDGKAMSFDTWEELTESRRPSAITPTAKGMEEANQALKELKPAAEKKSASALLDIAPAPKLALADMDSAIDLGEPIGGTRAKSRPGSTTMMSGSGAGSTPSGKLEPLLVRSFSQPPKTETSPSKVEWAPKIDKSVLPPRSDMDNTLRVEMAPSEIAASKPSGQHEKAIQHEKVAPAPATTRVIDAERPTAPQGGVAAADSIDELDSDSLLDDADDDEAAPLSLRDAIPDESGEELGDDDLHEDDPDPHELLSLRDLVAVPAAQPDAQVSSQAPKPSQAPKAAPALSQPPKPAPTTSQAPKPSPTTSQAPKPATIPPRAAAASQVPPPKSLAPPAPRPKSLSRPDVPATSLPPPTILPDAEDEKPEKTSPRRVVARAPAAEEKPNRTWMWAALAVVLLVGIGWRLSQSSETPPPAPTPTVATIAPPTPVTTPAEPNDTPPPTPTTPSSDTTASETPPTPTETTATPTGDVPAVAPKPVAENTSGGATTVAATPTPATPAEKKPSVPVTDAPGSMSELLDKAGAAKRKGDLATARDLYQRVIAMSPNNVEANGGLGDVAKAQGDLNAAKTSYERALAASPTYSPALLGLADVEWDQGNQASAKKRYMQIVDRMGDRAPARAKERSQ